MISLVLRFSLGCACLAMLLYAYSSEWRESDKLDGNYLEIHNENFRVALEGERGTG